jgi:hypothetical protein
VLTGSLLVFAPKRKAGAGAGRAYLQLFRYSAYAGAAKQNRQRGDWRPEFFS